MAAGYCCGTPAASLAAKPGASSRMSRANVNNRPFSCPLTSTGTFILDRTLSGSLARNARRGISMASFFSGRLIDHMLWPKNSSRRN
jgi:hypothetical protein